MSSRFDELSKALASGVPRRTVLKLFCASLLGSVAAPWTLRRAEAAPTPICSPACKPGQICLVLNGRAVCVSAGGVCSPPCPPGAICVATNGSRGRCVPGPCNPPCRPGDICVTLNGNRHVCVSLHCNPPCKGDEICIDLNGRPICVRRP